MEKEFILKSKVDRTCFMIGDVTPAKIVCDNSKNSYDIKVYKWKLV